MFEAAKHKLGVFVVCLRVILTPFHSCSCFNWIITSVCVLSDTKKKSNVFYKILIINSEDKLS